VTPSLTSVNNQKFLRWTGSSEHDLGLGDPVLEELTLDWVTIWKVFFSKMLLGK
jgi:hypothetical protein